MKEGEYSFIYYRKEEPFCPDPQPSIHSTSTDSKVASEELPVIRNKRGRRAKSAPQQQNRSKKHKQEGKPKSQQKEQQAYICRLRAGISKRNHNKPGEYWILAIIRLEKRENLISNSIRIS